MGEDRLFYFTFTPACCLLDGHYFYVEVININTCPRCGEASEFIPVGVANDLTADAACIFWSLCAEVWFAHGLPPVLYSLCSRCFVPLIIPAELFYVQGLNQHVFHYFHTYIHQPDWRLHSV